MNSTVLIGCRRVCWSRSAVLDCAPGMDRCDPFGHEQIETRAEHGPGCSGGDSWNHDSRVASPGHL